jgi:LysM repeat protein
VDPAEPRDPSYERLAHTLRLYRGGLVLCLLLILVLGAALVAGGRHRVARAIRLNGQVVCLVSDRSAAQRVHERLLEPGARAYGGTVTLREQWDDLDWPVGDREVLTVAQAVEELTPQVTPLVCGAALRVDGHQALIMPSRDLAEKALKAAQARFLAPGETLLEQHYVNKVEIADLQVPVQLVEADLSRAADALLRGSSYTRSYTVRSGDTPEQIARSLGLPLSELVRRVPSVRAGPAPGTKVQVKVTVPALKVVSVKEVVYEKKYQEATQLIPSAALPPGERRPVFAGEPGIKRVRAKQTWENNRQVRSVVLKVEILKPAQPPRVEVGEKPTS